MHTDRVKQSETLFNKDQYSSVKSLCGIHITQSQASLARPAERVNTDQAVAIE